jgi:xylulokinase
VAPTDAVVDVDDVLLGIDLGTGSSKGVLVSPDGRTRATATVPHQVQMPRPGWFEVDADAIWWADVVALCRELLPQADGSRVAGVCVSGVGPCLLLADADGTPLRPAMLYGIDMRATAEIAELTQRYGAEAILRRCGKALSTQAVGPKLLWSCHHEPEVWARTRRWFGASSYAVHRLTGEYVLDHVTASQCDPLYDLQRRDWAHDWALDIVGDLPLPRLVQPSEVVGEVTRKASEETGLPAGIPVVAGTVDAWAEAFSVGVRAPGDLMLMYGSTMFLVQVLPEPVVHPMLWTTAGVEPGSCTLAAGMATSGSLTAWLQALTGGTSFETLVAEAAATAPGADGLLVLPYFAGERSPIFDPLARGVVAGLSLRHTRGHLFRGAYEGIAYGIRQILELMDVAADEPASRVVAVGGGTQGGLWTQVVADVCGRPQEVPRQAIGASYGSALLAAIGTGTVPPSTVWAEVSCIVEPDPANVEVYDELYAMYRDLYPATQPVVHSLARMQERSDGSARSPRRPTSG